VRLNWIFDSLYVMCSKQQTVSINKICNYFTKAEIMQSCSWSKQWIRHSRNEMKWTIDGVQ